MGTGEMYRKTSKRHKAAIVAVAIVGAAVNLTTNTTVSTTLWIGLAGASALVFAALYGFRSRWTLTPAGRADFWMKFSFATLSLWVFTGLWFGDWEYRREIRDWLFLGYAIASLNALFALWGVQNREIQHTDEGLSEGLPARGE